MCLCRCFKDAPTEDLRFQIDPAGAGIPPTHSFTYFAGWNIQTLVYVSVFSRSKYICNSISVSRGNRPKGMSDRIREKKNSIFILKWKENVCIHWRKPDICLSHSLSFHPFSIPIFPLGKFEINSGLLLCNILHMIEGDVNSEGLREIGWIIVLNHHLSLSLTLSHFS